MVYLFVGNDLRAKDIKLADIKNKLFPYGKGLDLDYELFYADKLDDPDQIRKSLLSVPIMASKRLVVIRSINKLSASDKDFILEFARSKREDIVLVLDSNDTDTRKAYLSKISVYAKVFRFCKQAGKTVFDMADTICRGRGVDALKILHGLFSEGQPPLRILGALVWYWGRYKKLMSKETFRRDLLVLQEADLDIKRSRLPAQHAVEVAIVRLIYNRKGRC